MIALAYLKYKGYDVSNSSMLLCAAIEITSLIYLALTADVVRALI